jgi:general secretion pathway protein K
VNRRGQRGVILMSALILVALATIVSASIFFETGMSARRAVGSISMEQSIQLAQGAEALAAYALGEDKNADDTSSDGWAQPLAPVEVVPGVGLEALVTDETAKFNINSLLKQQDGTRDQNAEKVFRRLLELLEIETRFSSLAIDLIDANTLPEQDGGEDGLYTGRKPPHRTGNLALTSVSELQQLPGLTREQYLRLLPHVTALPPGARTINVCLASGLVLDALFAVSKANPNYVEYSRLKPEELAANRQNGCFPKSAVIAANEPDMQVLVAERSSFFRLHSWIRIGTSQFALYSLMYRDGNGQARPILRSFGTE